MHVRHFSTFVTTRDISKGSAIVDIVLKIDNGDKERVISIVSITVIMSYCCHLLSHAAACQGAIPIR